MKNEPTTLTFDTSVDLIISISDENAEDNSSAEEDEVLDLESFRKPEF